MPPLSTESPTAPWVLKCRNSAFVAICLVLVGVACATGMTHRAPQVQFFGSIALAWSIVTWCLFDARVHNRHFEHGFVIPMVATYPIAIAVYLVWTRGVHKGLIVYTVAVTAFVLLGAIALFVGKVLAG